MIFDLYMRNINKEIDRAIDTYGGESLRCNTTLYQIGLINYGKIFSKVYISNSGIYDYFYGINLNIQYVSYDLLDF